MKKKNKKPAKHTRQQIEDELLPCIQSAVMHLADAAEDVIAFETQTGVAIKATWLDGLVLAYDSRNPDSIRRVVTVQTIRKLLESGKSK